MTILVNHDIPSTMTQAGLIYLGQMAKSVPKNGIIIEIGPLFGSSTWVLAKNAHPSVKVISIDTWDPAPWIARIEAKVEGCLPFSLETFKEYVKDCPNVTPIQGWSPDIVADWTDPIDMFFDDASHGNPGFINNLDFFVPKVKPGGIVCGDDYAGGWPDIVREVDNLAEKWGTGTEIIGRVWSMAKPVDGKVGTVYNLLEKSGDPNLKVNVVAQSGKQYDSSPSTWAGALQKPDPIKSIKIDWLDKADGLDIKWKLSLVGNKETNWLNAGDTYLLEGTDRVMGFAAALEGPAASEYKVEYQLGFCKSDGSIARISNSKAEKRSRPLMSKSASDVVNTVLIRVFKRA